MNLNTQKVIQISAITLCAIATTAVLTLTFEEITRIRQVKQINRNHLEYQEQTKRHLEALSKIITNDQFARIITENDL